MKDFIKILCRFVPPYKKNLALNIIFNILAAFLTLFSFALIIPILEMLFKVREAAYVYMAPGSGSIKDVVVNNFYYYTQEAIATWGQSATLALLAGALVIMTGLKTGATFASAYFIIPMRFGIIRDIRDAMFSKITSLPIGFFTSERKGDVLARISGDVAEVEYSIMSSLDMLFKNPVMIIACLVMMFAISWELTLFVLVLLPVVGALIGGVGRRLKRTSLETQNQWGVILSTIEETLGGLRIVKAFNAEDKVRERFDRENGKFTRLSVGVGRRQALAHPMSEFLGTLAIAIILWFGGALILGGFSNLSAASFIYFMVIFYSMINPGKELSKSVYAIQKGMASMERIDKILKADNPIKSPLHPAALPAGGAVEYRDVHFRYHADGPEVINGVSFTIEPGRTVALVGQSGSGKSTLADLLPRFYDPCGGAITIGGTDIREFDVTALRSLMGSVSQEPILFNDTIFANIAFGVESATIEEVRAAARVANADEFIMATEHGYDTMVGDRGCRLSGGQRQRISIARAVLKNPKILILDEATSALDSESEAAVQQALERLMADRTTLVIAHRLSTIRNADTICVLHEGRIVEAGSHAELMQASALGYYRRLVEMQGATMPPDRG